MFGKKELLDIAKAYFALVLAFTILMSHTSSHLDFRTSILVSLIGFGLSFLLHELSHKFVAIHYGYRAEFRSFDFMLILAIIMSFFGFVFAAPGAVFIHGKVKKSTYGKIALAGPLSNLIIAFICFLILMLNYSVIISYIMIINLYLSLFNLLPFRMFDGYKIREWNPTLHTFLLIFSIIFLIFIIF